MSPLYVHKFQPRGGLLLLAVALVVAGVVVVSILIRLVLLAVLRGRLAGRTGFCLLLDVVHQVGVEVIFHRVPSVVGEFIIRSQVLELVEFLCELRDQRVLVSLDRPGRRAVEYERELLGRLESLVELGLALHIVRGLGLGDPIQNRHGLAADRGFEPEELGDGEFDIECFHVVILLSLVFGRG